MDSSWCLQTEHFSGFVLLASQSQALVSGAWGLLRERAGTAGQSRNAGTRVVHFGSLRLVCWVALPPHPTGNLVFLDSAGTWDPAAKFRLFGGICEIVSRYLMSFLQINSREIIVI